MEQGHKFTCPSHLGQLLSESNKLFAVIDEKKILKAFVIEKKVILLYFFLNRLEIL